MNAAERQAERTFLSCVGCRKVGFSSEDLQCVCGGDLKPRTMTEIVAGSLLHSKSVRHGKGRTTIVRVIDSEHRNV